MTHLLFYSDPVPLQWETCSGRIKFAQCQIAELETLFQKKMHPSRSEKEMLSKLFGVPKRKIEVFDFVFCSMTEKFICLDFYLSTGLSKFVLSTLSLLPFTKNGVRKFLSFK